MSADGADGADTGDAGGGDIAPSAPASYGTIGEIREALGLDEIEDLPPDDRDTSAAPADEVAAKRDAKGKFTKDEGTEGKTDAKADAEKKGEPEDDVAIVKAIEARSKARRQAREAARRGRAAPAAASAAPAPAAAASAPAAVSATSTTPAPSKEVETAVRDVLAAIDRLAAGDADATATEQGGDATAASRTAAAEERKQQLAAVNAKLDDLKKAAEVSTEAKQQLTDLQAEVRALNNDRIIRTRINEALSAVADDVPTLLDQKAIRAFNKEHGTRYVDATTMLTAAAINYHDKFKKAPDLELLARTIEKKLKGASPETTETATDEKPTPTRKTVSRNDGSPPAARGRDDERSFDEATADFNRKYGLDD